MKHIGSMKIEEILLNGILEDETDRYYHICFFGAKGPDREQLENYVFVPKVVCRVLTGRTVAIQEWYAKQHKLMRFAQQYRRENLEIDIDKIRFRQTLKNIRRRIEE